MEICQSTSVAPIIRDCFVGQFRTVSSSQHSADRYAGDIGEAEFPSLEEVGQLFVVDAQLVEDGGVQIVNGTGIADDIVREVVGFTELACVVVFTDDLFSLFIFVYC